MDSFNDEMIDELKMTRHGRGIEIFEIENSSKETKYEGHWVKDIKEGYGRCYYTSGDFYEGNLTSGLFHGAGEFKWSNGNKYSGMWEKGNMEGEGEFYHWDGHILSGRFVNNYFLEDNLLLNPFLSLEEYIVFKENQTKTNLKHDQARKAFCEANIRNCSLSSLSAAVEEAIRNNKTPIIVMGNNLIKSSEAVDKLIGLKQSEVVDLRAVYKKLADDEARGSEVVVD